MLFLDAGLNSRRVQPAPAPPYHITSQSMLPHNFYHALQPRDQYTGSHGATCLCSDCLLASAVDFFASASTSPSNIPPRQHLKAPTASADRPIVAPYASFYSDTYLKVGVKPTCIRVHFSATANLLRFQELDSLLGEHVCRLRVILGWLLNLLCKCKQC